MITFITNSPLSLKVYLHGISKKATLSDIDETIKNRSYETMFKSSIDEFENGKSTIRKSTIKSDAISFLNKAKE